MVRSILAVVLGWATVTVLAFCTDLALQFAFPDIYPGGQRPANRLEALALASTTLWSVGGGWLTACLARRKPLRHSLILLGCGEAVILASVCITWGQIQWWYQLGLLLLWPVAVAAGGWLYVWRRRRGEDGGDLRLHAQP